MRGNQIKKRGSGLRRTTNDIKAGNPPDKPLNHVSGLRRSRRWSRSRGWRRLRRRGGLWRRCRRDRCRLRGVRRLSVRVTSAVTSIPTSATVPSVGGSTVSNHTAHSNQQCGKCQSLSNHLQRSFFKINIHFLDRSIKERHRISYEDVANDCCVTTNASAVRQSASQSD